MQAHSKHAHMYFYLPTLFSPKPGRGNLINLIMLIPCSAFGAWGLNAALLPFCQTCWVTRSISSRHSLKRFFFFFFCGRTQWLTQSAVKGLSWLIDKETEQSRAEQRAWQSFPLIKNQKCMIALRSIRRLTLLPGMAWARKPSSPAVSYLLPCHRRLPPSSPSPNSQTPSA